MSIRTGGPGRRPRVVRLVAVAGALAVVTVLGGCSSSGGGPASTSGGASSGPAVTSSGPGGSASGGSSSVTPVSPSGPSSPAVVTPGSPPVLRAGYLPLWPFGSAAQVLAWQQAYRSGGSQAWHVSERETALAFAHTYLGYTEIDRVTSRAGTATDARVGVGWADPNGDDVTVGVVHLLRYGTAADAPWEVVGTKDSVLTLTSPRYGSTVSSPVTVGGRITGVDESLVIQVRTLSSPDVLAESAPLPAGGEDTPWSTRVAVDAPSGTVLTVSVSTGGHLMGVEAFAVTGVRLR